ncbi:MAG: hypothetical protein EZS28_033881, partial [Streblomastix strix]
DDLAYIDEEEVENFSKVHGGEEEEEEEA